MLPQRSLRAALLALAALTGCVHEEHPEFHPETSYRYVQNINYNTTVVHDVRVPPSASSPAAQPTAPPVESPPRLSPERADLPSPSWSSAPAAPDPPPHGTRPDLPSTGIAACDAYLARVETCSQARGTAGFENLLETLDLTRRNYRRALRGASAATRATFVDSCETGLRMFDRSLNGQCE